MRYSSHLPVLSFPLILKFLLQINFLLVKSLFSQVLSLERTYELYTLWFPIWSQNISFSLTHEYHLDLAWDRLVTQFYVFVDTISLFSHLKFGTREPQTLVGFPFVRNLYFHLCCWDFSRVLSILEACRICQVCVFSHQNSLELSKPSQSVDAGLFSSQINYLLLFNYCLSSICFVLYFWCAYHFYCGFPGSVLQFISYTSAFPSPNIFCPWLSRVWIWPPRW